MGTSIYSRIKQAQSDSRKAHQIVTLQVYSTNYYWCDWIDRDKRVIKWTTDKSVPRLVGSGPNCYYQYAYLIQVRECDATSLIGEYGSGRDRMHEAAFGRGSHERSYVKRISVN